MNILAIGDVTGNGGVELLERKLWELRRQERIDFCIVNAENASFLTGASPAIADRLFEAGADCLSGGNHTLQNKAAYTYLDEVSGILRPINFPEDAPGHGYSILDCNGYRLLVICAMGNVHIEPTLDSPYGYIDRVLKREEHKYDFAIMDIHAEATGEKLALGYAYDGRINIIFGTHTHVPTADQRILPGGTGYVTDLGMCGEEGGILGMDAESVIRRMRTRLPHRFEPAKGPSSADGCIFELDTTTGRVTSVRRIKIK